MNSEKSWKVLVADSAIKNLQRIPSGDQSRIMEAIDQMEVGPLFGDIIKLAGQKNSWRRRIGDYRLIFELGFTAKTVYIYEIKRRTSSTY